MKLGRIIWLLLVAAFVYWGASSDTLSNWLNNLVDNAEPLTAQTEEFTNSFIEKINAADEVQMIIYYNRILLVISCLALVLSILYRFVLKETAIKRDLYDNVKDFLLYSVVAVLLTAFHHSAFNWWTLPAIPFACMMLVYPLLYIPYYRYFRWVFAFFYNLLTLIVGGFYLAGCLTNPSLIGKILSLVFAGLAVWYFLTHRKFDSCAGCKRYVNIHHINHTIDKTEIDYQDVDTTVATGYIETTKYDKYGHKVGTTTKETGSKRVTYTSKIIKKYYTDLFRCPYCGYEYTETGVDEQMKSLGYKEREEKPGVYMGDLDDPNNHYHKIHNHQK